MISRGRAEKLTGLQVRERREPSFGRSILIASAVVCVETLVIAFVGPFEFTSFRAAVAFFSALGLVPATGVVLLNAPEDASLEAKGGAVLAATALGIAASYVIGFVIFLAAADFE